MSLGFSPVSASPVSAITVEVVSASSYTLPLITATFSITGTQSQLIVATKLIATSYAASLAYQTADVVVSRTLALSQGAYSLQAAQQSFVVVGALTFTASPASFSSTTYDSSLRVARALSAAGTSLTLTGVAANTLNGRCTTAQVASFNTVGNVLTLTYQQTGGYIVSATPVAFISSQGVLQLITTRVLQAATSNVIASYVNGDVLVGRVGSAVSASYLTDDTATNFIISRKVVSSAAPFALSGKTVTLRFVQGSTPYSYTLNVGRTLTVEKEIRYVTIRADAKRK